MYVNSMTKSFAPFSSSEFEAYSVEQPKIHSFLKKLEEKDLYNTIYEAEAIFAKFFVDIEVDANKIEKQFFIKDANTISFDSYTNFFKSVMSLLQNCTENGKKEFNISVAVLFTGNTKPNEMGTLGFKFKSLDPGRLSVGQVWCDDEDVDEVKDNIRRVTTQASNYIPRVKNEPQFDDNFELIYNEESVLLENGSV